MYLGGPNFMSEHHQRTHHHLVYDDICDIIRGVIYSDTDVLEC